MQTSKKTLTATQQEILFDQLCTTLSELKSSKDIKLFLQSLLSETEQSVLSKRFAIIRLLNQNKSYEEIEKQLNVSSATISSAASLRSDPAMQKALKRMAEEEWASGIADKIGRALPFMIKSTNS